MWISFEGPFDYESTEDEKTRSAPREIEIARLIEKDVKKTISHCACKPSLILPRMASSTHDSPLERFVED
jgi:hypothetical protein